MNRPNFPNIIVAFTVSDRFGKTVHEGTFRLADDTERRAFGQRCHEAMRDGFVVTTCRKDILEVTA